MIKSPRRDEPGERGNESEPIPVVDVDVRLANAQPLQAVRGQPQHLRHVTVVQTERPVSKQLLLNFSVPFNLHLYLSSGRIMSLLLHSEPSWYSSPSRSHPDIIPTAVSVDESKLSMVSLFRRQATSRL